MSRSLIISSSNSMAESKNANNQSSTEMMFGLLTSEILMITSFPPRECGIATYAQDLLLALNHTFNGSFSFNVCALESENEHFNYSDEVSMVLDTSQREDFMKLAQKINNNAKIGAVLIQHEFGLFQPNGDEFIWFLNNLNKPVIIVFHTILPSPDATLKSIVKQIVSLSSAVIVMTHHSEDILIKEYDSDPSVIRVIPHGTHLVPHLDKNELKEKYALNNRKILSTFGLLGSGKSIETTIEALPAIILTNPDVLFLVIGKTHPNIIKTEGEVYRNKLIEKIAELRLDHHVKFINKYLPLSELLEYLQLTDVYLFTSKDRHQAVSGTFVYAMSCGCPIISTPIPHAKEVINDDTGIIIDFENSSQLVCAVNHLLGDEECRNNIRSNSLQKIISTAWENVSISYAMIFNDISGMHTSLRYSRPEINLNHIRRLTTQIGMIQFSKINHPDLLSGYTLDDNARALIAMVMHYELTGEESDIPYIYCYFNFIKFCQKPEGDFLNYVDIDMRFTDQNSETNLEDSNGRAIWSLGFLISKSKLFTPELIKDAKNIILKSLPQIVNINSTRAMAFTVKGLSLFNSIHPSSGIKKHIILLADRLVQMYRHEASDGWEWFESYLTYANYLLPEALLYAYVETQNIDYKDIAEQSFDFLTSITFTDDNIKVVSNDGWYFKGKSRNQFGEQPIEIAYAIMALDKFYMVFHKEQYLEKMEIAFDWFLGKNHLQQTIYNPCTGGCFDGLEKTNVNLNQGAESTVSYLISRLILLKYHSLNTQVINGFAMNGSEL